MLFSQKKAFLIFLEMKRSTFQARLKKRKFYTSGNGNPEKKPLLFPQKKAFLISRKTDSPKKPFIFQKTELSYISGNGNLTKLYRFQEIELSQLEK